MRQVYLLLLGLSPGSRYLSAVGQWDSPYWVLCSCCALRLGRGRGPASPLLSGVCLAGIVTSGPLFNQKRNPCKVIHGSLKVLLKPAVRGEVSVGRALSQVHLHSACVTVTTSPLRKLRLRVKLGLALLPLLWDLGGLGL